ncbi:MAG: chemotaxis protein CheA [bacterium]
MNTPDTEAAARLAALVEAAAQDVVMLERRSLPGMARMAKSLKEVSRVAEAAARSNAALTPCVAAAAAAATLLERIILAESKDPARDFEAVVQTVSALQSIACLAHPAEFPPEVIAAGGPAAPACAEAPPRPSQSAASATSDGGAAAASVMDDDLFQAFVAQQLAVLPEIDDAILAFETDGAAEHLAALRRTIHTMKGESGVCGVTDIATVCHALEDYLNCAIGAGRETISADILFAAKDWLERAVKAYSRGERLPAMEEILSQFVRAPVCAPNPAAAPAPVVPAGGVSAPAASAPAVQTTAAPVANILVTIGDRSLAADFVGEAQEHFDAADENLMRLERDPANKDAIGAVFRAFHTIKGVSGFIGLAPIGELAHAAESLLDDVRKDRNVFSGRVADVTFRALDLLKQLMGDLGRALQDGTELSVSGHVAELIAELRCVQEGGIAAASAPVARTAAPARPAQEATAAIPEAGEHTEEVAEHEVAQSAAGGPAAAGDAKAAMLVKPSMKVDTEKIDNLLDTIGELVITESMVINSPEIRALHSRSLERNLSLLTKITRQLQNMSMSMRLIPVDATFKKMARLIRDLSKKSGKQINFRMEGAETEIDKSMVDKLGDPLVHMIRNSADHGIESVADRRAAGKNPAGCITLRAFHQGGSVCIQIADDGKGLNRDAILAKAIEKGMIKDGAGMSDQDVFSLIFEAGFSTAKIITDVSGRGVGMDVVRRNIESLHGKVLIESRLGQGATFTLVLPLTTAIIDGMLTEVGEEIYILPTLSIVQSFEPQPGQITTVTGRGTVVEFRGRLLPLYDLARIFHLPQTHASSADPVVVVVVEFENRQAGLKVNRLLGQSQTVIKSMGDSLGQLPGIIGASIMADGRPGMILDVSGIVRLAEAGG